VLRTSQWADGYGFLACHDGILAVVVVSCCVRRVVGVGEK